MNRKEWNNNYFLLRHGRSEANELGIIVSDPDIGTNRYGLTEEGIKQVSAAADFFRHDDNIIIFSSDFKRAKETAEIIKNKLSTGDIIYAVELRERYFGSYEGNKDNQYNNIWELDKTNADNRHHSVESPGQVAERTEALLERIEKEYKNRNVLLVSHGDCLQILQTVFEGISPSAHRSLEHLQTAEVRKI